MSILRLNVKRLLSDARQALARKPGPKPTAELEVTVRIHYADGNYRDWVENITVYLDPNTIKQTAMGYGTVQQFVQTVMNESLHQKQIPIKGYDVILRDLLLQDETWWAQYTIKS